MRLTKKNEDNDYSIIAHDIDLSKCGNNAINKLGEHEDIEEELGIELTTLFKILKANECYSKEDGECHIVGIDMNGVILMPKKFPFGECEFTVPFSEFGKTWALSREELL